MKGLTESGRSMLTAPVKKLPHLRNEKIQASWLKTIALDGPSSWLDFRFFLFASPFPPCMVVRFGREAQAPEHG